MAILKASQIDKWQKLRLSTFGSRLYLAFIISIKEMSLIEISSSRIFCLTRQEQESN